MKNLTIIRNRLFALLAIILSLPDPLSPLFRMFREGFNISESLYVLRLLLIYAFFTMDIFISSTIPDLRTRITWLRNTIEQIIRLFNNVNNYGNDERAYLISLKNSLQTLLRLINNNH